MFSRRLTWTTAENPLAALERARRSGGAPLLDLTITNPTRVGLPYPDEALAAALADPSIGRYDPSPLGPWGARVAVAAEHARLGARVSPEAIALTASSSESYALLFKLLCDPGDVVLVPQPSYPLFDYLARLEGVEPRAYRLAFDGQWRIDWGSLDPEGARALILVSPNNPTGSFLRRADLARLAALAAERDLALICDEVFSSYALSPAADAVRTVTAEPPAGALAFCLGGLSKSCGLPQMKLGWITAVGSPAAVAAALPRLELALDTYLSVGTPVVCALPRLLSLGGDIRRAIMERVSANRARVAAALGPASLCTLLPAEGGWAAILRVPAVLSDEDWALTLLASDDVLVQPGYFFDLTGLGATLVLSLLTPPADLVEGIRRLLARIALQLRT